MNRTKMLKQLDRTFSDVQVLYIDAFDVHNEREMMEIAEQFFGYCKKVWGRKYDSRTHDILLEQEFEIDYNRFVLIARVRELPQVLQGV